MVISLIRHGKSVPNELNQVTGDQQSPLSTLGRLKLQAVAPDVRSILGCVPDRHIVSPLLRAKQTAHILFPDKNWHEDARLAETDAGKVAEITKTEFVERYGQERPDFFVPYPGGESHQDLKIRVLRWFNELAGCPSNCMAVVTHAGPINILLHHLLNVDYSKYPYFQIENLSVTKLFLTSNLQLADVVIGLIPSESNYSR